MSLLTSCCRCSLGCCVAVFVVILAIFCNGLIWRRTVDCILHEEVPLKLDDDQEGRLRKVHVVYSFDNRGTPGALASMVSLAKHLEAPADCTIHLIVSEEMVGKATELGRCFQAEFSGKPHPDVLVHKLRPLPFDVSGITWGGGGGPGPLPESWVRLFIADYLPEAPRAIWLDCDTLVKSDIARLYRFPMNTTLAAVRDFQFSIAYGFNSGVILLDLDKYRSEDRSSVIASTFREMYAKTTNFMDQDVLNAIFPKGEWTELDWRWNAMGVGALFEYRECPHILYDFQPFLFYWKSHALRRHCWDSLKILHLTIGKKWWTRPAKDVVNCHLLAPHIQQRECMGFKFHC